MKHHGRTRSFSQIPACIICTVTAVMTAGCHAPCNDSDALYGSSPLPALELRPSTARASVPDQQRIASIDRSTWTMQVIRVQQAQVQHQPTYRSAKPIIASSRRADGGWPSIEEATCTRVDGGDAIADAALEPLGAAVDIALLPFAMIIQPPGTIIVGSPDDTRTELTPANQHPIPWQWVRQETTQEDDLAP